MEYIDIATRDIIIFAFTIIAILFIMIITLEIIANFFRLIFRVGKNKNIKDEK